MRKFQTVLANQRFAKALLASTALSMALTAAPAYAALDEVVVTATKREKSIQDVPVSVTAFNSESLEDYVMLQLRDLQMQTPGLFISQAQGSSVSAIVDIRGQVQNDSSVSTLDPSVGIYVNDVYNGRAQAAMVEMFDIASVEVLKGSQGTLYGRNTTGGAIKIATVKPEPGEPATGYVGGAIANYESHRYEGAVSFPLGDTAAIRIAARHNESEGWANVLTVDPVTGATTASSPTNGRDSDLIRASLVWDASEKLRITVGGEYYENDNAGQIVKDLGGDRFIAPASFEKTPGWQDVALNIVPEGHVENRSLDLTVDYAFDAFDVKAIWSYRDFEYENYFDTDGTSMPLLSTDLKIEGEQQSLELQFSGLALNDRLDWLAGLYYFEEDNADDTLSVFGTLPLNYKGDSRTESIAAFAHLIYAVTDTVNLTGGLRYTKDTKELDGSSRIGAPAPFGCIYDSTDPNVSPDGCFINASDDYKFVSWTVGLDWQISDASMIYAKAGTGQRSGGQQMRGSGPAVSVIQGGLVDTNAPFDEEEVLEYEIGIKNEFLDGRARLNAAYFFTDYSDFQYSEVIAVSTYVLNLGDAEVQGIEVDGSFQVTDGLRIGGFASWLDFEFDSAAFATESPELKWGFDVNYSVPVSFGEWNANVSYSYTDERADLTAAYNVSNIFVPVDSYSLVNGRIGLDLDNGISLSLFGRNLTDEEYDNGILGSFVAAAGLADPDRTMVTTPSEPRTYGIEMRYSF